MRRAVKVIISAIIMFGCILPAALSAEPVRFELLVPEESIAYIAIGNLNKLRSQLKESKYCELWNEPEIQKYIKMLNETIFEVNEADKMPEELRELLAFDELKELVQGEAAFCLISLDYPPKKPPLSAGPDAPVFRRDYRQPFPTMAFFVDVGSKREEAERLVDKFIEIAEKNSDENEKINIARDRYKDVEISYLKPEHESVFLQWAFFDSTFVVALSRSLEKGLHKIIEAHQEPRSIKPLGASAAYRKIYDKLGDEPTLKYLLNIRQLINKLLSKNSDPQKTEGGKEDTSRQVLDILGLTRLNTLVGGINIEKERIRYYAFLDIPSSQKKGLLKILGSNTGQFPAMKLAAKDVLEYASVHHNVPAVYKELTDAFQSRFPQQYATFKGMVMMLETQMMISLEADIIEALGSEVTVISSASQTLPENVILVEVKKTDGIQKIIDFIMSKNQAMPDAEDSVKSIDFAGYKLYLLPKSGGMGMQSSDTPKKFSAICLTDKYFMFGSSADALKAVLKRLKSPKAGLASSDAFKDALSESGFKLSEAVGFSYTNAEKTLDFYLSPQYLNQIKMAMFMMPAQLRKLLDPDSIPRAETLKKYFKAAVSIVRPGDEGIEFESVSY